MLSGGGSGSESVYHNHPRLSAPAGFPEVSRTGLVPGVYHSNTLPPFIRGHRQGQSHGCRDHVDAINRRELPPAKLDPVIGRIRDGILVKIFVVYEGQLRTSHPYRPIRLLRRHLRRRIVRRRRRRRRRRARPRILSRSPPARRQTQRLHSLIGPESGWCLGCMTRAPSALDTRATSGSDPIPLFP